VNFQFKKLLSFYVSVSVRIIFVLTPFTKITKISSFPKQFAIFGGRGVPKLSSSI